MKKENPLASLFILLSPCTIFAEDRLRLSMKKENPLASLFILLSPCTNFAEDRLWLGMKIKKIHWLLFLPFSRLALTLWPSKENLTDLCQKLFLQHNLFSTTFPT